MRENKITLKDGETEKVFIIRKHKAIPAVKMIRSVAVLLKGGELFNSHNLINLFSDRASLGTFEDGSLSISSSKADLLISSIETAIVNAEDNILDDALYNILSQTVLVQNGQSVTVDGIVDYIDTVNCLYELVKEIMTFNFGYFFSDEKKS